MSYGDHTPFKTVLIAWTTAVILALIAATTIWTMVTRYYDKEVRVAQIGAALCDDAPDVAECLVRIGVGD